jgi:type IV secretion system protein TrbI
MTTPAKENPERLELRARPKTITRLSRKTVAILLGGLALGLLVALMWGLRQPKSKDSAGPQEKRNVARVTHAEGLELLPHDYGSLPKAPPLGAPIGELGRPVLRAERDAGIPELPERPNFQPTPEDDAIRAWHLKEQSEADEASKAQVLVQMKQRPSSGGSSQSRADSADGSAAANPAPGSLRADGNVSPSNTGTLGGAGSSGADSPSSSQSRRTDQDHKQAFVDRNPDLRIYASATLQTPRSPFQLMAGTIIPAALVTGIQSDLPGETIASVTENVFDTVTGRALLIPQGARLIGEYDSQVAYGQRRVLVVWTRLIMPNGLSIVIDRLPSSDPQGYAGLEDKVDYHWGRLIAGAAISTLLGVNAELVTDDAAASSGSVVIATRQSSQDAVNQVGQEITRRNLDIQPTLTERPGLPLRIVVNRDLILKPYGS